MRVGTVKKSIDAETGEIQIAEKQIVFGEKFFRRAQDSDVDEKEVNRR